MDQPKPQLGTLGTVAPVPATAPTPDIHTQRNSEAQHAAITQGPPTTTQPEADLASSKLVSSAPDNLHNNSRPFVVASHYSGPMPPPELVKAYGDISPELLNRILAMAEKAQEHEEARNMAELSAAKEDMQCNWQVVRRGQFFGLLIGIGALTAAVLCFRISPTAAGATMGSILGGGGIATLIWAFRYDRKH